MIRLIKALVLAVLFGGASVAAWAHPTLVYKFQTTSIGCENPAAGGICDTPFYYERGKLDGMYIGLTETVLGNGTARIEYEFRGGGFSDPAVNQGFDFLQLHLYQSGSYTRTPSNGFVFSPYVEPSTFFTEIILSVGDYLTGSLRISDYQSELAMQSSGGTEWAGWFNSDALNQRVLITGNWMYSHRVPEPGTAALILMAIGGVALVSRRRGAPRTALAI